MYSVGKRYLTISSLTFKREHTACRGGSCGGPQIGKWRNDLWSKRHVQRCIQKIESKKQTHEICKLAALTDKLKDKAAPACPWDEAQFKLNLTAAEHCSDPLYADVYNWVLGGKPGTPMPKPLTEAEYQLKLNPPGLPGLKINKTRAEDKIKGWEKAIASKTAFLKHWDGTHRRDAACAQRKQWIKDWHKKIAE